MNIRVFIPGLAVVIIAAIASFASAHHSLTVEFDITKTMTLTGSITEMKWTNPHAWLYIDVKDEKGEVRNWAVEFASPNSLYRRGWRQTDLPPRSTVTVTGYPSRDNPRTISSTDVKLPDGRTLFAGTPTDGKQ
jgi:uncharacterized protein DUF6152